MVAAIVAVVSVSSFLGLGKAPIWAQPAAMIEADGETLESTLADAFGEEAWEANDSMALLSCGSMPLADTFSDYGNLVSFFGYAQFISASTGTLYQWSDSYTSGEGSASSFYDLWNHSNAYLDGDENTKHIGYSLYFDGALPDSTTQSHLINQMARYVNLGNVYYERVLTEDAHENSGGLRQVLTQFNVNGKDYVGIVGIWEAGFGGTWDIMADATNLEYSYGITVVAWPLTVYSQYGATTYDDVAGYFESLN